MTSNYPLNTNRPDSDSEAKSQAEYIRGLEARLQQISRFGVAAASMDRADTVDGVCDELLQVARPLVDGASVRLLVCEGETLRDLESSPFLGGTSAHGLPAPLAGLVGRAIGEKRTIWTLPEGADADRAGIVPIPVGAEAVGVLVFESADRLAPPDPETLQALEDLGRHAASAVERVHAGRRAAQARSYLDTLVEVDREILGATRLDEVIRFATRIAVERVGAAWGAAWLHDSGAEKLRLSSTFGGGVPGFEERIARMGEQALRALRSHGAVHGTEAGGGSRFLCAPMIAFDEPLGAIALVGRQGGKDFGEQEESFLRTLASQCALATQNAHLCDRERDALRRLEETQSMLMQTERLAALGELSAKVAHEIRNPLSAIGGFARRIEKALPETDPNASYAAIITREIRRLETILTEQLEFARAPRPRMAVVDLNETVRETIALVREETDKNGVQVQESYESRIPGMLLDGDRVKQVVLNILKNAAASTRSGQRIRVRTRASEGWAQVEIANDGERLAGEILEQLFVPFATGRNQGSGLGLAVADQIVKEHGGEIRVRSDEEWSVVFTVSFPIRQNQDKRRSPDRRRGRDRRWAA